MSVSKLESQRRWREKNREKTRAYDRARYERLKDDPAYREYKRSNASKWYYANKARALAACRRWALAHPDLCCLICGKYRANNTHKAKVYRNIHQAAIQAYRDAHRLASRAYASMYKRLNPIRTKANNHKRRAMQYGGGGNFTEQEWLDLCAKYGNRCLACGRTDRKLTVDHVVPVSKGGSNGIENIQPLCLPCNTSKHDRTIDYRKDA